MSDSRPKPGTLNDLLGDALDLGWEDVKERSIRQWHDLGLIGSPTRHSLGQGHGQAPATYSAEQRALFRAVVRHRMDGRRNGALAQIPVWAWLSFGDAWANVTQVRRATRTALGPLPPKSRRGTVAAARAFTASINLNRAPTQAVGRLNTVLTDLMVGGLKSSDVDRLQDAVSGVFEPRNAPVLGVAQSAMMNVEAIVTGLKARVLGARKFKSLTDEQLDRVRQRHHVEWTQFVREAPSTVEETGPDFAGLFDVTTQGLPVHEAVSSLLLLVGLDYMFGDQRHAS